MCLDVPNFPLATSIKILHIQAFNLCEENLYAKASYTAVTGEACSILREEEGVLRYTLSD